MQLLATVDTWDQAFDRAKKLLDDGKLTAITIRRQTDVANSASYVMTYLAEFSHPLTTLRNARQLYANLQKGKTPIELWHREIDIVHPMYVGKGWVLMFVVPD